MGENREAILSMSHIQLRVHFPAAELPGHCSPRPHKPARRQLLCSRSAGNTHPRHPGSDPRCPEPSLPASMTQGMDLCFPVFRSNLSSKPNSRSPEERWGQGPGRGGCREGRGRLPASMEADVGFCSLWMCDYPAIQALLSPPLGR